MHIDPLATAIVSGIAIVGMAAVLWPARNPKPELGEPWNHARVAKPTEEELRSRGIDPEAFFKGALTKPVYPGPASEVIDLDVAGGREPMVLGEEMVITLPRYFVPEKRAIGSRFWHVWERIPATPQLHPTISRIREPVYTQRKSALRAARRLNAKDAGK